MSLPVPPKNELSLYPYPVTATSSCPSESSSFQQQHLLPTDYRYPSLTSLKKSIYSAFISDGYPEEGSWWKIVYDALGITKEECENKVVQPELDLHLTVRLLHQELLRGAAPSDICPLEDVAIRSQEVHNKCYPIAKLEESIAKKMSDVRPVVQKDLSKLESAGNKHKNNILVDRLIKALKIPGVHVPLPAAVDNPIAHEFLLEKAPEVFQLWKGLESIYKRYDEEIPFFQSEIAKRQLLEIDTAIAAAFGAEGAYEALNPSDDVRKLLEDAKLTGDFLMVRSSGAEDSRKLANAGGNESSAYVSPTIKDVLHAIGVTIRSYFSPKSLQIRHNEGENVFEQALQLSVTIQRVIGEAIGGAIDPSDIPISLVLFSNEPLYIGNEKWRIMQLNVGYGHGNSVVGNFGIATDTILLLVSDVHPDKLYILYDNKEKLNRLAPIRMPDGNIALEKTMNPTSIQNKKILNDALLARLYHLGVVVESFFQDNGTDMEIVIKKRVIYPVQARPINRPLMLPTYIDLRRISELTTSPIIQTLETELLVSGRGSVVKISHQDEVLTAKTLEEAEKHFNKDKHKLVIVHEEEPANSHPTVNFKNKGIPCLLTANMEVLEEFLTNINKNRSLAICIQTGTIYLWNSQTASIEAFTTHGFTVFPGKICQARSLNAYTGSSSKMSETSKEMRSLIRQMGSATCKENALFRLQNFENSFLIRFIKEKGNLATQLLASKELLHEEIRNRHLLLEHFAKTLNQALDETKASFIRAKKEDRLRQLMHLKNLESLVVGCSSVDVLKIDRDINTLNDYQKSLSHSPHLMDLALVGNKAITEESSKAWLQFLLNLETQIENHTVSIDQIQLFRSLIHTLEGSHAISSWLTFYFKPSPLAVLNDLIQTLPTKDHDFVQQHLMVKQELQTFTQQISSFGDPATFPQAWEMMQNFIQRRANLLYDEKFPTDAPVSIMVAVNTMKRFVDLYDLSIKEMLSSDKWTEEIKVIHLKEMLKPFFTIFERWIDQRVDVKRIPINPDWPIDTYVKKIKELLQEMNEKNEVEQLYPRREFDVSGAVIGTTTAFSRMFPTRLIEGFTLIHQNLLEIVGILNNNLFSTELIEESALPDLMKQAIQTISTFYTKRLALDVTEERVTVKYNVPLRSHSGQVKLFYDIQTRQMTLEGGFIGPGRSRWDCIGDQAQLLSDSQLLPLAAKPNIKSESLSLIWPINNQQKLTQTLQEYRSMAQYTLRNDFSLFQRDLISRLKTSGEIQLVLDQISKVYLKTKHPQQGFSIQFLINCVAEDVGYKEATLLAEKLMIERRGPISLNFALILFENLNQKHQAIEEAMRLGINMVQNSDPEIRTDGYKLLIKTNYINEEVLAIARLGVDDPSMKVRKYVHQLLLKCVHNEQGYSEVLYAVQKWFYSPEQYKMEPSAILLITELVKKKHALEEAIAIARILISKTDSEYYWLMVHLKNSLLEHRIYLT